jgi:GntR family transcriptional regulator
LGEQIVIKTLDQSSVIPLYHQLKEILKDSIESGESKPGDLIPSENELQQVYNISRNTVKKALDDLVQEGILNRIQGKGTFVSMPKIEQSLSGFYSFSKVIQSKGLEPKDIILSLEQKNVQPSITRWLMLPENGSVVELTRLRCANNEPMILETSYIPLEVVPEISKVRLEENSLYDLMQSEYGIIVTKAKETFEPVLVKNYESTYLQVQEGSPALLLERTAFESNGRPVEFCRSIVRGDRCRFYTELL